MIASQNGHVEVVNTLLQRGAMVDHQEKVYVRFIIIFLCVITTLTVLATKQQPPHSYLTLFLP